MNIFRRVWHLLHRSRRERELVREMGEHRDAMHDPSKFGDTYRLLEQARDAWGWNWLDDAMQDLKLGIRGLMRAPAFTITGVLILSFSSAGSVSLPGHDSLCGRPQGESARQCTRSGALANSARRLAGTARKCSQAQRLYDR